RIAVQRVLEPARAEKGRDLGRLVGDRGAYGRVVQQRDPMRRAQPRQRPLELQRLLDRLADELLEDRLPPRLQGALAEAPRKPLDPREAHTTNLDGVAVENRDTAVAEDALDLVGLVGLVVVVAEHGHDWHLGDGELADEALRLVRGAGVGKVAAQG